MFVKIIYQSSVSLFKKCMAGVHHGVGLNASLGKTLSNLMSFNLAVCVSVCMCSNFRAYVRFRPGKRGVKGKGCLILIR